MSGLEVAVVSGIGLGCAYALVAVAYNIVLASSGVFNLAEGGAITVAVIVTYLMVHNYQAPLAVTVAAAVAVGGVIGLLSELIAVRRFLNREVLHTGLVGLTEETLVTTLGLSLAITAAVELIFGSNSYAVPSYVPLEPLMLGPLAVQPIYFAMLVVTIVVGVTLELFLRYTEWGLVTRAIIVDPEGAGLMGTNVGLVIRTAFVAAGMLAGIAAFLIAPLTAASAFVGGSLTLSGFAALAIGGFGSFRGAIVGGIVVGLVSQLSQLYLNTEWGLPAVLVVMLIVLVARPAGLFGQAGLFGSRSERQV